MSEPMFARAACLMILMAIISVMASCLADTEEQWHETQRECVRMTGELCKR